MAGREIKVNFVSDAKPLVTDIDRMTDALEDGADELARFGKDGDQIADGIKDGRRDAERELDRMEDALRDVASEAKRSGKAIGDDVSDGAKRARIVSADEMGEIKNEALANASETFSSFDGSVESFADGIQGTLGGLVSGLGPVGAAIGAAGALGIGLIVAALDGAGEEQEKLRERTAELADEYLQTGEIGATSVEFITEALKQLATETDPAERNLRSLYELVSKSGTKGFEDIAQAYAGDVEGLDRVLKKNEEYLETLRERNGELNPMKITEETVALGNQEFAQEKVVQQLRDAKTVADEAAIATQAYAASGGPELERKAELISAVNDAYDDAAASVDDYIDKESGLLDVDAYITAMQEREKAIEEYQETLASSPLSSDAKSFLVAQGVESAAQFLAGYKRATPGQQKELNRIWSEAGRQNSGEYTSRLREGIPKTMAGPRVTPNVDTGAAQRELDAWANRRFEKRVVITARDQFGRDVF